MMGPNDCPFCGGACEVITEGWSAAARVECEDCEATLRIWDHDTAAENIAKAVEFWNRPTDELAKLRDSVGNPEGADAKLAAGDSLTARAVRHRHEPVVEAPAALAGEWRCEADPCPVNGGIFESGDFLLRPPSGPGPAAIVSGDHKDAILTALSAALSNHERTE